MTHLVFQVQLVRPPPLNIISDMFITMTLQVRRRLHGDRNVQGVLLPHRRVGGEFFSTMFLEGRYEI